MLLLSREQNPENQRHGTILAIYCLSFHSPCKISSIAASLPQKKYFPADPAVPVPAICLTTALDSEDDLVRASLVYIYRVKSF